MATILSVEQLEARYEERTVFRDLCLSINEGSITTIIGPNGCGKSTLLKAMGRILRPKSGNVFLLGKNLSQMATKDIAKKLALLSQNPTAPSELKVEELISYGRYPHQKRGHRLTSADWKVIEWAMEVTKTTAFRSRELAQLSGGQRQKVWLAMALAQETDLLLLDEPTTYLDMAHQLDVLKTVRSLNQKHACTVVMVLHDINHAARFSDQLVAMKEGQIKAIGKPEEIMTSHVLRDVFDIDARIIKDPYDGVPVCLGYDSVTDETIYKEILSN